MAAIIVGERGAGFDGAQDRRSGFFAFECAMTSSPRIETPAVLRGAQTKKVRDDDEGFTSAAAAAPPIQGLQDIALPFAS